MKCNTFFNFDQEQAKVINFNLNTQMPRKLNNLKANVQCSNMEAPFHSIYVRFEGMVIAFYQHMFSGTSPW